MVKPDSPDKCTILTDKCAHVHAHTHPQAIFRGNFSLSSPHINTTITQIIPPAGSTAGHHSAPTETGQTIQSQAMPLTNITQPSWGIQNIDNLVTGGVTLGIMYIFSLAG